ncbi:MAG TPA: hypothetical protein VHO03_16575 [Ignavibacteriales bacterium]|nr:hypothetical protein [Ignavibacteriales bacterium]
MNIKNYSTTVPIEKSVQNIEKLLVEAGAVNISKAYNESRDVEALTFQLMIEQKPVFFKLEVTKYNANAIFNIITKGRRLNKAQFESNFAQAKRIAWKLLHEELHIQLTRIHLQQVEALRIFLPYVCDPMTGVTLYQKLKEGSFKLLTEGEVR